MLNLLNTYNLDKTIYLIRQYRGATITLVLQVTM